MSLDYNGKEITIGSSVMFAALESTAILKGTVEDIVETKRPNYYTIFIRGATNSLYKRTNKEVITI